MRIEPTKDLTGLKHGHLMPLRVIETDADGIPVIYECECQCGRCNNSIIHVSARDLAWYSVRCCDHSNPNDLTGMKFSKLTVIRFAGHKRNDRLWECKCDCGKHVITLHSSLTYGRKQSCNCGRVHDKTGQMFGYLKVLGTTNRRESSGGMIYKCQCTYNGCGKIIEVPSSGLSNGDYRSCGCAPAKTQKFHSTIERDIAKHLACMKTRCYNTNHNAYQKYNPKGICDEWLRDSRSFVDWALKNGYRYGLTIDRIDNSKGYFPENCRWITPKEQCRNKTNNHVLTVNGESKPISAWAEKLEIPSCNLYKTAELYGDRYAELYVGELLKGNKIKHPYTRKGSCSQ